jgi:sulfate transport system substrate-binding protein
MTATADRAGEEARAFPAVPIRRRPLLATALLTGATLLGLPASTAGASSAPSGNVNLVAYSTPAPAYGALIRAFNKTPQGKRVTFTQSYGPSGSQSKAVLAGQPADLVNFSLVTDMERLVQKNLVSSDWNSNSVTHGFVTDSIVVFVVPKGNPAHVTTWQDLTKSGVRVFTPNPFSSGSARWNIMAAYGAQLQQGKSESQAESYLGALLKNTVVQGTSAATEFSAFLADASAHRSDVFLDYEDDAIQAERAGQPVSYVVPKQTILIENPVALTTSGKNSPAAKAFYNYLLSSAGQIEWAKLGYRPVLPKVAHNFSSKFPRPKHLFTIVSLGGWDGVATRFFGTSSGSLGIVTEIEKSLGQSTGS